MTLADVIMLAADVHVQPCNDTVQACNKSLPDVFDIIPKTEKTRVGRHRKASIINAKFTLANTVEGTSLVHILEKGGWQRRNLTN